MKYLLIFLTVEMIFNPLRLCILLQSNNQQWLCYIVQHPATLWTVFTSVSLAKGMQNVSSVFLVYVRLHFFKSLDYIINTVCFIPLIISWQLCSQQKLTNTHRHKCTVLLTPAAPSSKALLAVFLHCYWCGRCSHPRKMYFYIWIYHRNANRSPGNSGSYYLQSWKNNFYCISQKVHVVFFCKIKGTFSFSPITVLIWIF